MDRRHFLRRAGAWSLAASLPQLSKAAKPSIHLPFQAQVDALVIGGGISGLKAADDLVAAGHKKVIVLEARERVGGRTLNQPTALGGYVELGGQWIGPTQDSVLSLMGELGIGKFETYRDGRDVDDTTGNIGAGALLDYLSAVQRIDRLAKQVPLDAPWNAARAQQWDRMTVRNWMDSNMLTSDGKDLLEVTVATTLGGSPSDISFLWFLFYVHAGTDFDTLSERAQRWRIKGGAQQISLALAQSLGLRVVTEAVVNRVRWSQRGVVVQLSNTQEIAARKLIIAMMPRDADRIVFEPALPTQRRLLQQQWDASPGDKYFCTYATPFWRNGGLSGQAYSDSQFIGLAWDNSSMHGVPGVLGGFSNYEGDQRPPTRALRKQAVIDSFIHFFGPEAAQPLRYHEYSWADDLLTEGCVSPLRPQLLTQLGPALRAPVGPIHWAGTESSEVWCGYMDGAVRAGSRAAREVDALLP